MGEVARRGRPLSCVFHGPHPHCRDRRGTADAAEFVFRVFRRQQQERFLPGLDKSGSSSAACGRRRALSLSLELDRRRACRIHV